MPQSLEYPNFYFMKVVDITGNKYNYLTVLKRIENKGSRAFWVCKCDCGNITTASTSDLKINHKKSCGCYRPANYKHGMSNKKITPEYSSWHSIKNRCFYKKCEAYKTYGAVGVTMYEGWVNDFVAFFNYIGKKPSPIHTVDRFPDNNGNYVPGNIRWATPKQQSANIKTNVNITFNGVTKHITDWGIELSVAHQNIRRYLKLGKSFEWIYNRYTNRKLLLNKSLSSS